ncbi:MAG: ABC transporter transmembrane domain-containing protein, partial [Candidatus Cloacimonadaceae bacterium]|nr:ABC transporter transmembrane domain-containing protein [Candidatus Cloacimonadaceae bacterium]
MNSWGGGGRGGFQSDDLKGKVYDRRLYSRMLKYLKPYLGWVILSFVILMVVAGAEVVLPLIQRTAIDDYIVSDKSIAVFESEAEIDSFYGKYEFLKLKRYDYSGKHFLILSAKDRNRIIKTDLSDLEASGNLSKQTVFLLVYKPENVQKLNAIVRENTDPKGSTAGVDGWFRINDETIAIARENLNLLPQKQRLEVRQEAAHNLLWLALIFFGIILLRLVTSYFQSVITAYFSQMAMNDLRHDVFAHLQKMPVKYFDQNPVGRLLTRVTNDIRAIDEMLASGVITIVQDVILIIAIVTLMLVLNWRLALVSFIILPVVLWVISEY